MNDEKILKLNNNKLYIDINNFLTTMSKNVPKYHEYMKGYWEEQDKENFNKLIEYIIDNKDKLIIDKFGNVTIDGINIPENGKRYLKSIQDAVVNDIILYDKNIHGFDKYLSDKYDNWDNYYKMNAEDREKFLMEEAVEWYNSLQKQHITIDNFDEFQNALKFQNRDNLRYVDERTKYIGTELYNNLSIPETQDNKFDNTYEDIIKFSVPKTTVDNWENKFNTKDNFKSLAQSRLDSGKTLGNTALGYYIKWIINLNLKEDSIKFNNGILKIKNPKFENDNYSADIIYERIPSNKIGGTLKYQTGGKTNTTVTENWDDLMKKAVLNYLKNNINVNNFDTWNNVQKSYTTNRPSDYNLTNKIDFSENTKTHQDLFNKTGLNSAFSSATITGQGIDGSSTSNESDGLWGAKTELRHLGKYSDDYAKEVNNIINNKGLEAYNENGMLHIKPLNILSEDNLLKLGQKSEDVLESIKLSESKRNKFINWVKNINNTNNIKDLSTSFDVLMSSLRFADSAAVNKKIHNIASKETPFIQPISPEKTAIIQEDLRGLEQAQNLAGLNQLRVNLNLTNDSSKNIAGKLEASRIGNYLYNQAKQYNDLFVRQRIDNVINTINENVKNRFAEVKENLKNIYQTEANQRIYDMATLNKQYENRNLYFQELQHKLGNTFKENYETKKIYFDTAITSAIQSNPKAFIEGISNDLQDIYLRGAKYGRDQLNENDKLIFDWVSSLIAAETAHIKSLQEGFDLKDYWDYTKLPRPTSPKLEFPVSSDKKGGKLKERIANADRFYKVIKDQSDRNQKTLDSLFKTLYSIKK